MSGWRNRCEGNGIDNACDRKNIPARGKISGMSEPEAPEPVAGEPDANWLTAPEMRSWQRFIQSSTGLLAMLDNELQAEHALSLGDYEVLHFLAEAPDHAIRMSDLAERLHLSPSGITRRIDGLVKAALVERRPCPSDRRGSNAALTPLGLKTLRNAAPTHVRGVREHFVDRLTAGQLAQLASVLSAIDIDEQRAAGGCDSAV
jgi:DNA-binding MarR family transcriptional regulator